MHRTTNSCTNLTDQFRKKGEKKRENKWQIFTWVL